MNISKDTLLEYKKNKNPITILLPYSKKNIKSFNNIKIGIVE